MKTTIAESIEACNKAQQKTKNQKEIIALFDTIIRLEGLRELANDLDEKEMDDVSKYPAFRKGAEWFQSKLKELL